MLPPKKTLQRHEVDGAARFLTFSCFRRLRLFDNERIKDRFVEHLVATCDRRGVRLFAWVVMPEHVHLVIAPDAGCSIETFLRSLKTPFANEVVARWRELNASILPRLRDRSSDLHFWQRGGGYDRAVVGTELFEKIRYCHRNPIARGLCATSVDWPWSSARRYEARADAIGPPIPLDDLPPSPFPLT